MGVNTATFEVLDNVALAVPKNGLAAGTLGTIVDAYPGVDSYTVEFFDEAGETLDVIVCAANVLTYRPSPNGSAQT